MVILYALGISIFINLVMFLVAYKKQTDKLTDLSYSLSFAVVALSGYVWGQRSLITSIALSMVIFWALRLGSYLFMRINKMGRDKRFDEMRSNFFRFGRFWLLQAITVVIVLLPIVLLFDTDDAQWSFITAAGLAVYVIGLTTEAVADSQKFKFISDPRNKGKWIDEGLWQYSRHPNYLGEILVWTGVYLFALPSLVGFNVWLAFISPVFITAMLLFVSGIPLLEESADAKWGADPAYRRYKSRTGILLPRINR